MNGLTKIVINIKNGYITKKDVIKVKFSKLNVSCLNVLQEYGYIKFWMICNRGSSRKIDVYLKYFYESQVKIPVVNEIYNFPSNINNSISSKSLWGIEDGIGCYVISTSCGIITDSKARKLNIGGKLLFYISL